MRALSAAVRAASLTLAGALLTGVALALPATAEQPAQTGWIRLGHLSPQTPAVDVYLAQFGQAEQAVIRKAGYGVVSGYSALTPGKYTVSMRPAGAAPDSPVALTQTIDVAQSTAYSILVFENGPNNSLKASLVTDDLGAPAANTAKLRLVQGAAGQPVTVKSGNTVVAQDADYGTTTPYTDVPAGTLNFEVTSGSSTVPSSVDVAPGTINTVLVTSVDGALKVTPIKDSTEAATAPVGAVATGDGSTVGDDDPARWPLALAALAGVVLLTAAGATVAARRQQV